MGWGAKSARCELPYLLSPLPASGPVQSSEHSRMNQTWILFQGHMAFSEKLKEPTHSTGEGRVEFPGVAQSGHPCRSRSPMCGILPGHGLCPEGRGSPALTGLAARKLLDRAGQA